MGSFQIVYDDFSGGQYMGPKSNNLPKNAWHGNNAIALANGRLCPVGSIILGSNNGVSGATGAQIMDSWTVGKANYSFVIWSSTTSKMSKFVDVNDGTQFPLGATNTNLTGTLGGKVAYVPAEGKFYYVNTNSGTFGYIRSVTTTGTDASVSTALGSGTGITNVALYGYRLIAWGPTTKRLYYSDTALTGWSTSQYYEFNGEIVNAVPRANDLLVICTTGVFSVVGVLGSSVTIQQIVPQQNVTEGMRDATTVGRNLFFLDQMRSGSLDGNIYRLLGSQSEIVATMILTDVNAANDGKEKGRIQSVADGRLLVTLRSGVIYTQSSHGRWARLTEPNVWNVDPNLINQVCIARPGPESQNEYSIVSYVDDETQYPIRAWRITHNVTEPRNLDNDFVFDGIDFPNSPTVGQIFTSGDKSWIWGGTVWVAAASTQVAEGNVELSEYWHQKPFTVKEMLVEWAAGPTGTPIVSGLIKPTGLVDVNQSSYTTSESYSAQETSTGNLVVSRLRADDSPRGYGVKPNLTFQNAVINRVILMCED